MKIKEVCSQTGLTARTIRYYIDEQLISPYYTENYLGRRFYDFSEQDVKTLKDISVLRRFGFSLSDIKTIKDNPSESKLIIKRLREQKEAHIQSENKLLSVLNTLDNRDYTLEQLSLALSEPVTNMELPNDIGSKYYFRQILHIIKFILSLIIAVLPFWFTFGHNRYYVYPTFCFENVIFVLLTFIPTIIVLLLYFIKSKNGKRGFQIVMSVLCIIALPFSFVFSFGITGHSETTDIYNYRKFDSECLANRSDKFQALFPTWYVNPKKDIINPDGTYSTINNDVKYYYRYLHAVDYTYDIYAEWPLEKDKFSEEVKRVKALYQEWEDNSNVPYVEVKKGAYNCLFWYYYCSPPFEPVDNNYTYYIFAYDEENMRVRYIMCDSFENGVDQPYYLQLDW